MKKVFLLLYLLLGVFSWGDVETLLANDIPEIVARVNGTPITSWALKEEFNRRIPLAGYHVTVNPERIKQVQREALEYLIHQELIYQEALRQGMIVDQSKVNEKWQEILSRFPSPQRFKEVLQHNQLTEEVLRKMLEKQALTETMIDQEINAKATVSDQDLLRYYEENKEKFVIPERVKVRQLLVKVDPGGSQKEWEEGRRKAENIRVEFLQGGDFLSLVRKYSDSPQKEQGGEVTYFHRGSLEAAVEKELFSPKVGEVSRPIQSIYGFHLFRIEEKKPAEQRSFTEINQEKLRKELFEVRREKRYREWVEMLRQRASVEVYISD